MRIFEEIIALAKEEGLSGDEWMQEYSELRKLLIKSGKNCLSRNDVDGATRFFLLGDLVKKRMDIETGDRQAESLIHLCGTRSDCMIPPMKDENVRPTDATLQ